MVLSGTMTMKKVYRNMTLAFRFIEQYFLFLICVCFCYACGARDDDSTPPQESLEQTSPSKTKTEEMSNQIAVDTEINREQKIQLLKKEYVRLSDCSENDTCFAKKKMIEDTIHSLEMGAKQEDDLRKSKDGIESDLQYLEKLDSDVLNARKKYMKAISEKNDL